MFSNHTLRGLHIEHRNVPPIISQHEHLIIQHHHLRYLHLCEKKPIHGSTGNRLHNALPGRNVGHSNFAGFIGAQQETIVLCEAQTRDRRVMLRENADRRIVRRGIAVINAAIESAERKMRVSMIQCEVPNGQTRERIARLRGNRETEVLCRWTGKRTSIAPVRRFPRKRAWFGRWRRKARRRSFDVRYKATNAITWIGCGNTCW